jgi:hypothetical protein
MRVTAERWSRGERPWRARIDGAVLQDARRRVRCFGAKRAALEAARVAAGDVFSRRIGQSLNRAGIAASVAALVPAPVLDAVCAERFSPHTLTKLAGAPGGIGADAHVSVALDACEERGIARPDAMEALVAAWDARACAFLRRKRA